MDKLNQNELQFMELIDNGVSEANILKRFFGEKRYNSIVKLLKKNKLIESREWTNTIKDPITNKEIVIENNLVWTLTLEGEECYKRELRFRQKLATEFQGEHKHTPWYYNPWIIGIGTAVIAGLILLLIS